MTEDNENDREVFAIPLGAMLESHVRAHERHHMQRTSIEMRINNFLDGLNVEQLVCLRHLLHADSESAANQFFDGQILTLLRVVHHVDGVGRSEQELLDMEGTPKEQE